MKKMYFKNLVLVLSILFLTNINAQEAERAWRVLGDPTISGIETISAATIETALETGKTVTFSANKTYAITGTIEIKGNETLHIPSSVQLNISSNVGIKMHGMPVSPYTGVASLTGNGTIKGTGHCAAGTVGIQVEGFYNNVAIGRVTDFGIGIFLLGTDSSIYSNVHGCSYNNVKARLIEYCGVGVELNTKQGTNGWVNQNYIHVDEIRAYSNSCPDIGILIDTNTANAPNHNFFSGSIEGNFNVGVEIRGGMSNSFHGMRFELTPSSLYETHFRMKNASYTGATIEPRYNFVYAGGSGGIDWNNNVDKSALSDDGTEVNSPNKFTIRESLLFYGSRFSDLYSPGSFYTALNDDERVSIGSEKQLAKFSVNGGTVVNNPIASFYYNEDRLNGDDSATRLNINGFPQHMELVATYYTGGANLHLGTALNKRAMTIRHGAAENIRIGIKNELPDYELDVNGTINALNYLVDGVALAPRSASNDTQFAQGDTAAITDESNNEGIDISRLYNMKQMITDAVSNKNTENENSEGSNNVRYLFSMEELEQNFPELVYINEETEQKSVDYISFIPLMVKKLKEQEEKIMQLEAILIGEEANTDIFNSENNSGINTGAKLYQNIPNPNSSNAEIKVFLPEDIQTAKLLIFDLQGKKLKDISIDERSNQTINILASEFTSGMYLYSLVADGRLIDTKRMLIDN